MTTELKDSIFKTHFALDYERRMSFQKVRLFDHALQFDIPELLGVDLGLQTYRIRDGVITHWVEKEKFDSLYRAAEIFFKDDASTEKIDDLVEYIEASLRQVSDFSDVIPDYSIFSHEELSASYTEFCEMEKRTSMMNQLLFMYFEKSVTGALQDVLGEDKQDIIEALSLQTEPIPSDVYQRDLGRYLSGAISQDELLRKYVHLGMVDVIDPPRSAEKIMEDADHMRAEDPEIAMMEMEKKYREQENTVKEALSRVGGGKHVDALIRYYRTYSDKKEWKNFIRERSSYKLSKLLGEIGKRTAFTLEELAYLSGDEILGILRGTEIDRASMKSRRKSSLYVLYGDTMLVVDDSESLKIFDINTMGSSRVINGDVACGGKAIGKVCVILSNADFGKFKSGDIIVAPTTRPDYLPLMRESAAIITNEGGKLSHAAILSRELKKPCIIGTKIATQVLHDGDLVEVDADKGIIRIIERADVG
jgi:phosphohistidine swiveling domain-containing protein